MSTFIYAAALFLTVFAAHAQIRITSLNQTGRLSWTNSLDSGSNGGRYSIIWSSNLNVGIAGFLRVTNQTYAMLTNFPSTTRPRLFYRVLWNDGEVWSMNFYYQSTLIATGKVYTPAVGVSGVPLGRYEIRSLPGTRGLDWFTYFPKGHTVPSQLHTASDFSIAFQPDPPGGAFDYDFWLETPDTTDGVWTGIWYESGFAGGIYDQGGFVGQRLASGQ